MQIFNVDLTVLKTFPWLILKCLPAIHYMTKASILTEIIQLLEKNPTCFSKTKFCSLRNLAVSVAFYGKKFQTQSDTSVKSDIINWQKTLVFSVSTGLFPSIFKFGQKKTEVSEFINRGGQDLNVILNV